MPKASAHSGNAERQKDYHSQTLFELLVEVWMSLSCWINGLILQQPSGRYRSQNINPNRKHCDRGEKQTEEKNPG